MPKLYLILGLFVSFLLVGVTPAKADGDWKIGRFHSDISLQPDGKAKVVETIEADFGSVAKHGIFRDVPSQYASDNGDLYTTIEVWSVERDGTKEPYQTSTIDGYERIKIGDASKTISGVHTYTVTYFVSGVLKSFDSYDELYWNVTGNGWEVPIGQASATVTLPRQNIIQISCYQGEMGSKDICQSLVIGPLEARFVATQPLSAGQGLTVAVGYTKGIVPLLTVDKPQTITDQVVEAAHQPTPWILLIVAIVAGLLAPVGLWWKRGRDWSWQQPGMLESGQTAYLKPLWLKPQVVAEFGPPDDLRPAQLGLLLDEKVNTLDITSTIIDLAARGYLTIKELPKSWVFGSADYQLLRTNKTTEDLLNYESLLLSKLFDTQESVKLSSLKNTFYQDLAKVQQAVYDSLKEKNYFVKDPRSIRTQFVILGIVMAALGGGLLWLAYNQGLIWLMIVSICPIIAGISIAASAGIMTQRTALGYEIYRRSLGYKQFIATAEKYQQQFFEKQNLFNQVLPYAMVLGLTHKFAEAMKVIGYEPASQPGWYSGQTAFNVAVFSSNLDTMSRAMSSTLASAPSSSGSGGGGSSGGGFGGGGGGSW